MSGGYHISQKHLLCTQQCTSHQIREKKKTMWGNGGRWDGKKENNMEGEKQQSGSNNVSY